MSFVIAAPDFVAAAASDLANIAGGTLFGDGGAGGLGGFGDGRSAGGTTKENTGYFLELAMSRMWGDTITIVMNLT